MNEKNRLKLHSQQLKETTTLLEEARDAKSFMALEKLLKRKHELEEQVNDLEALVKEADKTAKRSSKEELDDLFAIIEKLPVQTVRQIKQACEARLGG